MKTIYGIEFTSPLTGRRRSCATFYEDRDRAVLSLEGLDPDTDPEIREHHLEEAKSS